MRILLYGLNYLPELTGIGKYTGEFCEWCAARGHQIRAVCAVPYYPEWRVPESYRGGIYRTEYRNGVIVSRSSLYVPRHPKTGTRILHLLSFAVLSAPLLLWNRAWRPDIVIGIAPTLFCAPATLFASRLFGAASLLHIQDFELDAMSELGMGSIGRLGTGIERWLIRHFDAISTISYSMMERASARLGDGSNVLFFPNWVDIDYVRPGRSRECYLQSWDIPLRSKVVLYSGNMGRKQGLEIVLEAAHKLKSWNDVLFILVGAGAAGEDLRNKAEASALTNVRFFSLQPYEKLPELMALADVHLIVQRRGAADTMLPSKLTTILAAGGNALITADAHTELGRLCERHPGIACCIEPEDPDRFTDALQDMLGKVDVDNRRHNDVARAYAEQYLDKQRVLERFEADMENLIKAGGKHS